jgi:hypothetical protein
MRILKTVAVACVIFVVIALLASFVIGASRELTIHILAKGFPITIASTVISVLLVRYFKSNT